MTRNMWTVAALSILLHTCFAWLDGSFGALAESPRLGNGGDRPIVG